MLLGGGEESVADLATAIEADPGNSAREIVRLESAGIVASRRVGRAKLVRANTAAPFYRPLLELITIVLGPAAVLREHLSDLNGIAFADIFGSWAARAHGQSGPPPADIDLLVVGNLDRDDLHDATQQASRRLNRTVNPVVISQHRWETSEAGFVRQLRSRPRVPVIRREDP
jgi:predicted nucleotidyltransferase